AREGTSADAPSPVPGPLVEPRGTAPAGTPSETGAAAPLGTPTQHPGEAQPEDASQGRAPEPAPDAQGTLDRGLEPNAEAPEEEPAPTEEEVLAPIQVGPSETVGQARPRGELISGAPLENPDVAVHIVQQKRFADRGRHELTLYPA